jgi:flavodoxin
MKALVVYYSKGGKTRKVAEAISTGLECGALDVGRDACDAAGLDLLVVGSGTYGGMPGPKIVDFPMGSLQVQVAPIFATSADRLKVHQ